MSGFDEDILRELSASIPMSEVVVLEDADRYESLLLRRFPFDLGSIMWHKFPADLYISQTSDWDHAQETIRDFLKTLPDRVNVRPEDHLIWLGDNTDCALKLTLKNIVASVPILFGYPQHFCVIPEDVSWCMNYTMTDILYFGFPPNKE